MILNKSIPLYEHCNYKIGGNADYFFEFTSIEDLRSALAEYKEIDSSLNSVFVLGSGTNVLFSDEGFQGLVLKNSLTGIVREGEFAVVRSGSLMEELVSFAVSNCLSGLEWAGGLPGTVGGAVRGNAGAFGGETKDSIIEVESLDIHSLEVKKRSNSDCKFDYRFSVYKSEEGKNEIIISAKFGLKLGNGQEIKDHTQKRIDYRIERHPLDYPNIGSTFKNVPVENVPENVLNQFENSIKQDPFPVLPVAKLIAFSGLVGKQIGGAQISEKHPNFIVNLGNARAEDVIGLIDIVKKEIKEKYDINLEEEIRIVPTVMLARL